MSQSLRALKPENAMIARQNGEIALSVCVLVAESASGGGPDRTANI